MENKVSTILKENMALKEELQRLVSLVSENEAKYKGFTLVEDAFLTSESLTDLDSKALAYLEEIFDIDKAVLFLDKDVYNFEKQELSRIYFTPQQTLKYAYVEKRPYFGSYIEGLISDFRVMDDIASYIIAPIVEKGRITCSLNLYSKNPQRISGEAHADFIKGLMIRVWITLRNLHNIHLLKVQNQQDYLTGLYNKSYLHAILERYLGQYKSANKGFSFILADLDNFKSFNNERGHIAADGFLKDVSERLKSVLGETVIGRFGGDEFYFILDTTEPCDIRQIFNTIFETVKSSSGQFSTNFTISGGYSRVPEDTEENIIEVVRLADNALRMAKKSKGKLCGSGELSLNDGKISEDV